MDAGAKRSWTSGFGLGMRMSVGRPGSVGALALAACVATPMALVMRAEGVVTIRTIAVSGDPAPGLPGLTMAQVLDPRINELGRTIYQVRLAGTGVTTSNDGALISDRLGATSIVLRESDPAPGTSSTINGISTAAFNASGRIAVAAAITNALNTVPTSIGVFVEDQTGVLALLARDDPAASPNYFTFPGLVGITGSGATAWSTPTVYGVPLVSQPLALGSVSVYPGSQPGGVRYDSSTAAPGGGLPAGSTLRIGSALAVNASGRVVFKAEAGVVGTAASTWRVGLFTDRAGPLERIALLGEQIPGAPTGQVWRDFSSDMLIGPGGADADVVFVGRGTGGGLVNGADTGIYLSTAVGGSPQVVPLVLSGQAVPGVSGAAIGEIHGRLNRDSAGTITFLASLRGQAPDVTPLNNAAIAEVSRTGAVEILVREGEAAPGTSAGVVFGVLGEPRTNAAGRTAFTAYLRGPSVTGATRQALFATTRDGRVVKVARTGDAVTIPGRGVRVIRNIIFDHDAGDTGFSQYTSGGTLIFRLDFTDTTHAIVAADINCTADFDGGAAVGTPDGGVTLDDLLYYLQIFDAGDPGADVDDGGGTGRRDGAVTIADLLYYLLRYEAGC